MFAVFKREFRAYMNNVYGYLFMAVLLLFFGALVAVFNVEARQPHIEYALYYSRYVLLLMIPVLCMRSMAEDRRNKTDLFYLSLPLRQSSVVMGKYFALLLVFAIPTAVICLYPLLLGCFGTVRYAASYLSILFFFLIGASLIAVCQFLSSLTDNLVVAAVLGVLASVVLCFLPLVAYLLPDSPLCSFVGLVVMAALAALIAYVTTRSIHVTAVTGAILIIPLSILYICNGEWFRGLLPTVLEYISPFYHFEGISENGIFCLPSLLLILSYPVFFLYLTVRSADRKRWA